MKRYYIAYGSNLSIEQMAYRCPQATIIGTSELIDYKLLFKGAPTNSYATIEESKGYRVPVLIWELQAKDEQALDRYEGYPTFYYKKTVSIEINNKVIEAMIYIMNYKANIGIPNPNYYNIIEKGYRKFNFDNTILKAALKISIDNTKR